MILLCFSLLCRNDDFKVLHQKCLHLDHQYLKMAHQKQPKGTKSHEKCLFCSNKMGLKIETTVCIDLKLMENMLSCQCKNYQIHCLVVLKAKEEPGLRPSPPTLQAPSMAMRTFCSILTRPGNRNYLQQHCNLYQ